MDALQLDSLVHLAEMVAFSALQRRESRCVHYRYDFPEADYENYTKNNILEIKENGELSAHFEDVVVTTIVPPKEAPSDVE